MLKLLYATLEEIPEALRSFYKQQGDGKWLLQVDDVVPKAKFEEFRDNNHNLLDKIRTLEADIKKYEGIDPDKAKSLMSRATEIENGELVKKGEVDKVKQTITAGLTEEHQRQIAAVQKTLKEKEDELEATKGALSKSVIDGNLLSEARKLGLDPDAEPFLVSSAREVWKLENGVPVAYAKDGRKEYGRNGDAISMTEWLERLSQQAKFMFKPNQGSGAGPAGGGGAGSGAGGAGGAIAPRTGKANPWAKGTKNLTEQMKLVQSNVVEARRLCIEAGEKPNF